jgi:ABC-type spermidine/putrescine transport system permease subunit I
MHRKTPYAIFIVLLWGRWQSLSMLVENFVDACSERAQLQICYRSFEIAATMWLRVCIFPFHLVYAILRSDVLQEAIEHAGCCVNIEAGSD